MTGPPRSQRLLSFASTAAGNSPAFVCPDGYVVLVKSAQFTNFTTTAVRVNLVIGSASPYVQVYAFYDDVPADGIASWSGWVALNPGDFVLFGTAAAGINGHVFGAVLVGAPQFPPASRLLPTLEPHC